MREASSGWDQEFDIIVVGSGQGGLTAAITAQKLGLRSLVIEKQPLFGGSSALSGGGVWIPNNPVNVRAGVADSLDKARAYLQAIVGDRVPAARREAYLVQGPKMLDFLEKNTRWVRYQRVPGYSDYHPEAPGGDPEGRSIEPIPIDARRLGEERQNLNRANVLQAPGGLWLTTPEYRKLLLIMRNWEGRATALKVGFRTATTRILGRKMLSNGGAGITRLRLALRDAGGPLWLNTVLNELVVEDGRVVGVRATKEGTPVRLEARLGVLLAAGGFERNAEMRHRYQAEPITATWTSGAVGNTGDGIRAGQEIGAAVEFMDRAWWGPSILAGDIAMFFLAERSLPGSIMVNSRGERFTNEAAPYVNAVDAMYAGQATGVEHVPSYLIFDQQFRNRYPFIQVPPRKKLPSDWLRSGMVIQADTLSQLATKLRIPPDGLEATVARFNRFAETGEDEDFRRGESAYDRYYGDPTNRPNPNLAPLRKGPFYGARVVPGDLGTCGGLKCDEHARVLREDQTPIPGLYATGNCSGAVMGHEYAGPGATLGPAMTFGFIAVEHMAGRASEVEGRSAPATSAENVS